MDQTKNLSIEEVAQWLEVNPRTVYRLAQIGEIPGFKVGGQWRFNEEILRDWMVDRITAGRFKGDEQKK